MSSIALACFSTPAAAECAGYATGLGLVDKEAEGEDDEDGFHDVFVSLTREALKDG